MKFKNIFKSVKNRLSHTPLKKQQYTELQRRFLAYKKELKHLRELQSEYSVHPTKELALELHSLDKKVVKLNMEYIKFYENKRKNALSVFQKELDKVTTKD